MRDIETGITYINDLTIGAEVDFPFGEVKQTRNEHSKAGSTQIRLSLKSTANLLVDLPLGNVVINDMA